MTARERPVRLPHVPLPSAQARASAEIVALAPSDAADIAAASRALPDPATLAEGTLVVVRGAVREPRSIAKAVLAALGRAKTVPRAVRCSALVVRGYVEVGAGTDPDTREDLAWGYVPPAG